MDASPLPGVSLRCSRAARTGERSLGDEIDAAKHYDFDDDILLEMAPHADHFEIHDE